MPFDYIETADAMVRDGLRMTVVSRVPSPWGEAAKGILHIKGIAWSAVRLDAQDPTQVEWSGHASAPAAVYNDEPGKARWNDLLFLFERIEPEPSLLPADPVERALMIGMSHEICGEQGLGPLRRMAMTDAGLREAGGFQKPVAQYLAAKYGHSPEMAVWARTRIAQILDMLASRLESQRAAGSGFYIGDKVSALDVYSACFMAMFSPLPEDQCAMKSSTRAAFETRDESSDALRPILLEHRDMMYKEFLEMPLSL
ncbi:MAG: hypothetical protein AAFR65_13955 [Pseudomonadota bacterium]